MPVIYSQTISPEWQNQDALYIYTRSHKMPTSPSEKSSMLGSLKNSFRRKNSARSTSSRSSQESNSLPVAGFFRSPTDISRGLEGVTIANEPPRPASYIPQDVISTTSLDDAPPAYAISAPRAPASSVPSSEPPAVPTPAYALPIPTISAPHLVPAPLQFPVRSSSPTPSASSTVQQREDPYIFLSSFDTVLLIDDSGSMAGRSWRETKQALTSLLPIILAHDRDGIDIFFLNEISSDPGDIAAGVAPGGYRNVCTEQQVEQIFKTVRPRGGTPMGTRCRAILKPYLAKLEIEAKKGKIDDVKPLNILSITDGVPSDDVESVLLAAAKKLDALDAAPHQVGVQFFQVGNEEGAAEALKELDDGLGDLVLGGVRDMVDTCTWMGGASENGELKLTGDGILKVLLGAVVRRLDRKRCSVELRRT